MTAPSQDSRVITFKCPKCGWLYHTSEPISQLDCLGCEARVITEERQKPALRAVQLAPSTDASHAEEFARAACLEPPMTDAEHKDAEAAFWGPMHGPTGKRCCPSVPSACSPQCGEIGECLRVVGKYPAAGVAEFNMLDALKERLPAGWSPERFDKLLDDDIKEQSQQNKQ